LLQIAAERREAVSDILSEMAASAVSEETKRRKEHRKSQRRNREQ
jgi:hypothetical protein